MELSNIPEGYDYSKLPIFHLAIASTSLITGLNYKFATMLSVSLVQIICNSIFLFLLAKYLFNFRIGLLASLMVIIANHHIYMSYWSIPNTLAAVFIPIILYLLFKVKEEKSVLATVLSIFFMLTLILTHTVTAMCMAIVLFVSWATFNFYNLFHSKNAVPISLRISILFTMTMFAWWTYASGHITTLADLIKWGFSIDYFVRSPREILEYAATVPIIEQVFNNLGIVIFFSASFIGVFYMISEKGNNFSFTLALVGFTIVALGFFSLITKRSIIEHRWWYFSEILLAIPLAVGVILIITRKKRDFSMLSSFLLSVFVVFLTILMIMSPPANVDNHIFSLNSEMRSTLILSELQAAKTLSNSGLTIKTDEYYAGSMKFTYHNFEAFCAEVYKKDLEKLEGKMVLIREEIVGKPFKLFSSIGKLNYDIKSELTRLEFSKVYDCKSVEGFLKSEGAS
jgi:hypothetical protein